MIIFSGFLFHSTTYGRQLDFGLRGGSITMSEIHFSSVRSPIKSIGNHFSLLFCSEKRFWSACFNKFFIQLAVSAKLNAFRSSERSFHGRFHMFFCRLRWQFPLGFLLKNRILKSEKEKCRRVFDKKDGTPQLAITATRIDALGRLHLTTLWVNWVSFECGPCGEWLFN